MTSRLYINEPLRVNILFILRKNTDIPFSYVTKTEISGNDVTLMATTVLCVERNARRMHSLGFRTFRVNILMFSLSLSCAQESHFFIGAPLISSIEIANGGRVGASRPIITVDNELQR